MTSAADRPQRCTFRPLAWQAEPWRDRSRVVLLTGSAGGGKSRLAAEKVHGFCLRYPRAVAIVVRKTRESLAPSAVFLLRRQVIGRDPLVSYLDQKRWFRYANGSVIFCLGMNDEAAAQRLRSIDADLIWVEEANQLTESDFNELLPRLRGRAAPWRQVILTTNPDGPQHWIYRRLIHGGEAAVYYSGAADNHHNPADYTDTLSRLTGVKHERLVLGRWVQAEGAVYAEFDPALHLLESFPVPAHWRRIRSVDFGYRNPFVCQWWAVDGDGRAYLYREIYETGRLVEDHARLIARLSDGERFEVTVCDHDAEGRATLERYIGGRTVSARKDVTDGIDLLHIDGNHDFDSVAGDIEDYLPKVVSGGFVVLDDIDWEGVAPHWEKLRDQLTVVYATPSWGILRQP